MLSGTQIRAAKRNGDPAAFTRAQALQAVAACATVSECARWDSHPNKHVRKAAQNRIKVLANPPVKKSVIVDVSSPSEDTFNALVEKFRLAGKKDPVKSARASIAASAQAAQRRALSAR